MAVFHWGTTFLVLSIACSSLAAPGGGGFAASASASGVIKPPITFDGGNVGVNFGGYHASAGLGGLLTGDASKGGLHAEAGTPFGQSAGAGLGGAVSGQGRAEGGLYAGASSGAGQHAEAGLGGVVSGGESSGGLYASADSGAKASSASFAGSGSFSNSFGGSYGGSVSGESHYEGAPVVVEETVKPSAEVHKTYIERTVIPNYVEKTIQVPSYVEKTIRVPTVIEKKVRVEAPPTIVEKTVESQHGAGVLSGGEAVFSGGIETSGASMGSGGGSVSVVEKSSPAVVHRHWAVHQRKPLFGGFFAGGGLQAAGGGAGGFGGGSGGYGTGGSGAASYSFRKSANPQLINDIFNIPISTLGAVNRLVSGIVGGTSGSLSVSKHYSTY